MKEVIEQYFFVHYAKSIQYIGSVISTLGRYRSIVSIPDHGGS